jgi:Phosphoglucomutase/phosphomannomutase, alpha/beta/alpha domain III/E1-E2 ATPase
MIDQVTSRLGRTLYELPVGFKWFVDDLHDGSVGFGGEENGGVSCPSMAASRPALLSVEIAARMGRDPGEICCGLAREFGESAYACAEAPATPSKSESWRSSRHDRCHRQSWLTKKSRACRGGTRQQGLDLVAQPADDAGAGAARRRMAIGAGCKPVPGDCVHLRMGDLSPADVRIADGTVLLDQSALIGESAPVEAGAGALA